MLRSTVIVLVFIFGASSVTSQDLDVNFTISTIRIAGGDTGTHGQFPYQISLLGNDGSHRCGGSILSEKWMLTAAHCVYGQYPAYLKIVVGTISWRYYGPRHNVLQIIPHEGYNPATLANDVALMQIADKIVFNQHTQPISLATSDPPIGTQCVVSGWGEMGYGSYPTYLLYLTTQISDLSQCKYAFMYTSFNVKDSNLCTLSDYGYGICQGDSGGPLVCNGVQTGIVSFNYPCANGVPDVYTSVASHRQWIKQTCGI